jgi:hypothetical protein
LKVKGGQVGDVDGYDRVLKPIRGVVQEDKGRTSNMGNVGLKGED